MFLPWGKKFRPATVGLETVCCTLIKLFRLVCLQRRIYTYVRPRLNKEILVEVLLAVFAAG